MYLDVVVILNFFVDFLLLIGTNRLCGYPTGWGRSALAAGLGGAYGGVCLLPGFAFLANTLWRVVSLALISLIAFGMNRSALRRGVVFVLLSMALGGIALGLEEGGIWGLLGAAVAVAVMCSVGFPGRIGATTYVPVEISYGNMHMHLTALEDTGNTLRDPVTGRPVLVVGADVASRLVGLTPQQLRTPVESISAAGVPGLRLIPYRGVGQPGGMLLALRINDVKIGKWKGSSLVAFAPEGLGGKGTYQALTGGTV